MSGLPYEDVRIIEKSATLTGRLIGLLFADQGAEVFVERAGAATPGEHDRYLDRGKIAVPPGGLADTSSADVVIVDGTAPSNRDGAQIVVCVTAAIPGDGAYGHLAADCSEDLLNALVGIFTDMAVFGRLLGRPVIYTPLPICSVYAGVHGAIAVGAALADRERCGVGREIVASRLAGGVSAIGALTLTSTDIPAHLGRRHRAGGAGAPQGRTWRLGGIIAGDRRHPDPVAVPAVGRAGHGPRRPRHWPHRRRAGLPLVGRMGVCAGSARHVG